MNYNHILDELTYRFREELRDDLENESGLDSSEFFTCNTIDILDDDAYDRDDDFTNWNDFKFRDGDLDYYIGESL